MQNRVWEALCWSRPQAAQLERVGGGGGLCLAAYVLDVSTKAVVSWR